MDVENATEEELREIKKWFFKENMRLKQERSELEEAKAAFESEKNNYKEQHEYAALKVQVIRKQLDKEKRLFEIKWKMLEDEVGKLAAERDEIERERKELLSMERKGRYEIFFVGVNSSESLKKRYRELMKIFHPDNLNGDTSTIQEINKQYQSLMQVLI